MSGLNILIKAFMISEFYGSVTIIGSQLLLGFLTHVIKIYWANILSYCSEQKLKIIFKTDGEFQHWPSSRWAITMYPRSNQVLSKSMNPIGLKSFCLLFNQKLKSYANCTLHPITSGIVRPLPVSQSGRITSLMLYKTTKLQVSPSIHSTTKSVMKNWFETNK